MDSEIYFSVSACKCLLLNTCNFSEQIIAMLFNVELESHFFMPTYVYFSQKPNSKHSPPPLPQKPLKIPKIRHTKPENSQIRSNM